jgi:pimeloyl-ACP methyl ester carboxylesterase
MMAGVPRVLVNGIDLAWERAGEGPPLLFLHGSGSSMASNVALRRPFERRFDVLTMDHRATGESQIPVQGFTMADCAADALALADLAGWERFRVLGMSFGGMVALELAVTAPERIERLALLCTSAGGDGGSSFPLHEGPPSATVIDTRFTPEWLADHPRDRTLLEVLAKRAEGKSFDTIRGEGMQLAARRHHDVWDRLDRIACPTLVAAGCYDGLAPLANSEALAERITDATLRVYEGGHVFVVQDRAAMGGTMDFLAR